MRQCAKILVAIGSLYSSSLCAETLGGLYYQNENIQGDFTVIAAANNTSGVHIQTLVIACGGNDNLSVVAPGTSTRRIIAACNPQSGGFQGIVNLPPVYLPPGYSMIFGGPASHNQIYMTYDMNSAQ